MGVWGPMDEKERLDWITQARLAYDQMFLCIRMFQDKKRKVPISNTSTNTISQSHRVTFMEDSTIIDGTIEEIAELYLNNNQANKKKVLDFEDTRILQELIEPTPANPMEFIGLRWSLMKAPSKIVKDRDFCYLEIMSPFVVDEQTGRRGWARCTHSIQHPRCPDLYDLKGCIRGELFYCGQIFIESVTTKNQLESIFFYDCNTRGDIPGFIVQWAIRRRSQTNTNNLNHLLQSSRTGGTNNHKKLYDAYDKCKGCTRRMSRWKPKRKCTKCDAILCKKCTFIVYPNDGAKARTTRGGGHHHPIKICVYCLDQQDTKTHTTHEEAEDKEKGSLLKSIQSCHTFNSSMASSNISCHFTSSSSSSSPCQQKPVRCFRSSTVLITEENRRFRSSTVLITKEERAPVCDLSYLDTFKTS